MREISKGELASGSGGNGRWLVCARPPMKEKDSFKDITVLQTSKTPQAPQLNEWKELKLWGLSFNGSK